MDDLKCDDTDPPLREWAKTTDFSRPDLARLSVSICQRANELARPRSTPPGRRSTRPVLLLGALAAGILTVCYLVSPPRVPRDSRPGPGSVVTLADDHLAEVAQECARLFGPRVAWLAQTGKVMQLSVDQDAQAMQSEGEQVTVRVIIMHRQPGSTVWQPVFSTSVITRAEEVIDLPGPSTHSRLRLWTHVLPDRAVAVDSTLTSESGQATPHWSAIAVMPNDGSAAILPEGDQGEYQVWQSAAIMPGNAL